MKSKPLPVTTHARPQIDSPPPWPGRPLVLMLCAGMLASGALAANEMPLLPPPGLVSWWPGDGHSLDIVNDNDAYLEQEPDYAPGRVDQGFSFTSSDENTDNDVLYAPGIGVDELQEFTIDAWVRIDAMPKNQKNQIQRFVTLMGEKAVLRHDGENQMGQLHFYICTYDTLGQETWFDIRVNAALKTGEFYHVAGTYDGNWMRLYLNGIAVGQEVETGDVTLVESNGVELSSPTETLDGVVDEVDVFNRALTADEVHAIYAAGSAGKVKGALPLERLAAEITNLEIHQGIANSLIMKLATALDALVDSNETNDVAAINSLWAFINQVSAQRGKKISEQCADALIASALEIILVLPCR